MAKIHTLKKFKRSKDPPRITIKEPDIKIMRDIADFRLLNARQIMALHPKIGERTMKRKLQLMFHNGFLDRPKCQFSNYGSSDYIIYALGRKGAKSIFNDWRANLDWTEKNRNIKSTSVAHILMVCDFLIALKIALHGRKEQLIHWQTEDPKSYFPIDGRMTTLRPDVFFTIRDGKDLLHFFFEADLSNTEHKRFFLKMRAYWQLWRQAEHKKKLGIERFRVLTATISEQRKENLRAITKGADDRKQGSEMFLFACEKNYNLKKHGSILEPIWQSPKNDKLHHLLE